MRKRAHWQHKIVIEIFYKVKLEKECNMIKFVHSNTVSAEDAVETLNLLKKRSHKGNGNGVVKIREEETLEFPFLLTGEDCRDYMEWFLHVNKDGKDIKIMAFESVMFYDGIYTFTFSKNFLDFSLEFFNEKCKI